VENNIIFSLYKKIENSKFKVIILFFSFIIIVFTRIVLEIINVDTQNNGINKIIEIIHGNFLDVYILRVMQYFFWYLTIFLLIFSCFRYIVKINKNKILYFSIFSLVLFIPVVYCIITNNPIRLSYLSFGNFLESVKNILTLFIFDEHNFPFTIEMIFLLVGVPVVSYLFSKNIIKSIVNTLAIYFLSGFLCGFVYICPNTYNNLCLIGVNSNLGEGFFMFYWIFVSFLFFIVFMFKEIKEYLKDNDIINLKEGFFFLFLDIILLFFYRNSLYFFDFLFISLDLFIIYALFIFFKKHRKNVMFFPIISFFCIYCFFILFSFFIFIIK